LLGLLGVDFDVVVPRVEEESGPEPERVVVANALAKARAVAARAAADAVVLGADTDVVVAGATIGKPDGPERARSHLEQLSGITHRVLSGVALIAAGRERTGLEETLVTFAEIPAGTIDRYVASGEWRDRAGGYAVQGLGSAFVRRVEGDLSNVIGLPIPLVTSMIDGLHDGLQTL
jgi:septum formation protein